MNNWLVVYVEKYVIDSNDNETIIQWFHYSYMKTHRIKFLNFIYLCVCVFLFLFFCNVNIFKFYFY